MVERRAGSGGAGPGAPLLPPPEEKAAAVRDMFGAIAPRYDLLNHLLSLNIDRLWRRRAVAALLADGRAPRGCYLDLCAGTFDFALTLAGRPGFQGLVAGCDFALPMLQRGRRKLTATPVRPVCGDALALPFADDTFDGATVGFGVRNLADLSAGLRELHRVLRPGARLVVLEFATPRRQPLRALYFLYFKHILPAIGRLVSGHGHAYTYLPASVLAFPEPPQLAGALREAGFADVSWRAYTGGIVAVHAGRA